MVDLTNIHSTHVSKGLCELKCRFMNVKAERYITESDIHECATVIVQGLQKLPAGSHCWY